jgi:hypothetical protein
MAPRFDRGTIQLRAQEIVLSSLIPITLRDACRRVLEERYRDDPAGLLEAATTLAAGAMTGIRKRTYEIPEQQAALTDIPGVIGITSPEGDMFVQRSEATVGQVRQWNREAMQHHSTQRLRHKRFRDELGLVEDIPDEAQWQQTRQVQAERQSKILEGQ